MAKFHIASMTTDHFNFEGAGTTDKAARDALRRSLDLHAHRCNLSKSWWRGHYDIETRKYEAGAGYRDGTETTKEKAL